VITLYALLSFLFAGTNTFQDSAAPQDEGNERRGSTASQLVNKSVEPSTNDAATNELNNTGDSNAAMMANNPMAMNSQVPYGLGNQADFNNSMGFPMNNMNGMSSMMGNGNWNGMNSMGKHHLRLLLFQPADDNRFQQHERHVRQLRWKHGHGHE
jgi:hypothetical protein